MGMDPNGNQIQLDPTEDEEIVARVAAIDVAKDSGMVSRGCRTRTVRDAG